MIRHYFDEIDGTVDEIDTYEELRCKEAREEAAAEEYEAFLEREYTRRGEDGAEVARRKENEYWRDLERRKWEFADKLLAQAYGED